MRAAHLTIAPIAFALLALAACGGAKEDNQVTETRMDDIDGLEGTISDDAINIDASTDEAPVEAAPVEAAPVTTDAPKAKLDKAGTKETGGPDKVEIKADEPPTQ
jgi:hypothetical protein